jgi:phospholipid transport system transporter-binding protein
VSDVRLEQVGAGRSRLTGPLTFDTVPQLLQQKPQLFADGGTVELDLAGVERSDSAGLALLVSWVRQARQHGGAITFLNVPDQLIGLAKVGGVEQILAFVSVSSQPQT